MSKFKIGDRVRIKTWEELVGDFGLFEVGKDDIQNNSCVKFTSGKILRIAPLGYRDKLATIGSLGENGLVYLTLDDGTDVQDPVSPGTLSPCIKEFKSGEWYRWVGPYTPPHDPTYICYWKSEMNFMLDGREHQCKAGTRYFASFFDCTEPDAMWSWQTWMKYFEKVEVVQVDSGKGSALDHTLDLILEGKCPSWFGKYHPQHHPVIGAVDMCHRTPGLIPPKPLPQKAPVSPGARMDAGFIGVTVKRR